MSDHKDRLYAAPLNGDWEKSSFSNGTGDDCVLIMPIDGGVAFGDSKARGRDGALRFTDKEMLAHILAVKAGQYDHLIPEGTEL
ncbi:DUF397 domain-containing protein [Streptomyces scopuliridis]|uniref:DUF397 domain-containing protein n=1 Tax=Streptomyces scopuliridis TaxID=452529 RepID=A0ACD4ZLU0_9ACTN|nr:DUF397 domain-containing protein [Streptomyces scopuliridis]WSB33813.1 DUF397 domain-containing protein [Streptomyces scopuliridis]WSB98086.1 DUF397 domain-containing protein [Streptomyces scopuliridis]WSC08212.1 DUF397 domain-containing protein [Streptomyces scopuliridis]